MSTQIVLAFDITENNQIFYDSTKSFRYPQMRYGGPRLSPDDKWIIYLDKRKGISREKLCYSKVTKQNNYELPITAPEQKNAEKVIIVGEWSPKGNYYECSIRISNRETISIVDFTGNTPRFLESFDSYDNQCYWTKDESIVFKSKSNEISMKKPTMQSKVILKVSGQIEDFEMADDGTILYKCVHCDNNKESKYFTFNFKKNAIPVEMLVKYLRKLSPNGVYALSSESKNYYDYDTDVILVNAKTNQILFKWKMYDINPISDMKWSPDGKRIAYTQKAPFKADKSEFNFTILNVETLKKTVYGIGIGGFTWSPDGKFIVFGYKEEPAGKGSVITEGIWILRVSDGKEIGRLSDVGSQFGPYISPSGEYIVWDSLNTDTFFIVKNPFKENMKN